MNGSKRGATGFAAGLVCAMVVSLIPGAQATGQRTAAAPRDIAAPSTASSVAAAPRGTLESKVHGSFGRDGVVRGTFDPIRFFHRKGEVYAVGVLHAALRKGDGTLVGRADRIVTIPLRNATADAAASTDAAAAARTCDILNLVLGPLDLNLLGLEIHLNRVVLDIVATTGAGNLLGNLLCAVVGLLDGTPTLTNLLNLANVLNRILSLLRL